jgi:N-acetylmuramoyl-L-alanine amidase
MRVKGATLQQILLATALASALCWNLAHAGEIKALALEQGATGTRAEILLDASAGFSTLSLSGPHRLVLDLPATSLAAGIRMPVGAGVVKSVRAGHPTPGTTRVVFDLASPVVALKPRLESTPDGTRLVLEWPGDGAGSAVPAPAPIAATSSLPPPVADAAVYTSAASAAATARLVASLPRVSTRPPGSGEASPEPASPGQSQPTMGDPRLPRPMPNPVESTTNAPRAMAVAPPPGATKSMQQLMRGGMRPLVIAIDAGHGGHALPGGRQSGFHGAPFRERRWGRQSGQGAEPGVQHQG